MLVGICGSICAGKHTIAEYLVQHHGFLRLHLPHQTRLASTTASIEKRLLPSVTDEKGTRGLTFPDVDALLDFVTKRWREHWVLTDIYDEKTLERLLVRPFFLLVGVDASISLRYRRFSERCRRRNLLLWTLEQFVDTNDAYLYSNPSNSAPTSDHAPISTLLSHSHLSILNNHPTTSSFNTFLSTLDLPSPTRLRPTWDAYFMTLASLAARRSNCMKRRVGCVLINENRIVATGYNGTPRNLTNCNEGGCARCNGASNSTTASGAASLSTCLCLHAEENALLEAGRERIKAGTILYCDTCPCLTCSVKIVQVGIGEVVFSQQYDMDEATARVFGEAGVRLRQFSPPRSGLVCAVPTEELKWEGDGEARLNGEGAVVLRNGEAGGGIAV